MAPEERIEAWEARLQETQLPPERVEMEEPSVVESLRMVEKDVERSMANYDVTVRGVSQKQRKAYRAKLKAVLRNVVSDTSLGVHYIQGFHDIASTVLIANAFSISKTTVMLKKLCLTHLKDFVRPTLDGVNTMLSLLFPLIQLEDPAVHRFLRRSNTQPYFVLSWVLTWFSHNFYVFASVLHCFDFLIESHPLMPIYMSAALIIYRRQGLLCLPCEYSEVHQYYQEMPALAVNELDCICQHAKAMMDRIPPSALIGATKTYHRFAKDSPMLQGFDQTIADQNQWRLSWWSQLQRQVPLATLIVVPALAIVVYFVLRKNESFTL